jgi:hypothetical protein
MSKYIGIPESYDSEAGRSQKCVSPVVVGRTLSMLAAIQLDNDTSIDRREVANVESNLVLPAEFESSKLSVPDATPQ